ncbi:MAG: WGR domain-containing protein [Verrucomicrobiae bacterium]
MQSTTLYYREGSSDKVYRVSLEERDGGYVVLFAYGRRGSTLNTGTKTSSPVYFDAARMIYDKLVREKMAKGYTTGEDSMAYHDGSKKVTDIRPQLLNPVDDPGPLLRDNGFYLQPKHDGKRLLLHKKGEDVTGINRRGIECGIPESIRAAAMTLRGDFLVDGEAVGDTLHVFDILEVGDSDIRAIPYRDRLIKLLHLLGSGQQTSIQWVATISGHEAKTRSFDHHREENAEGVVFKQVGAPYSPGRPNSGGSQFKYKFVETASVIVNAINAKRSVQMAVWENAKLVPCGNVTIPADQPIPQVGDLVDVRYLYTMAGSGSLFQPVYLGVRDDIATAECTRDQLKFRREPEEEAA